MKLVNEKTYKCSKDFKEIGEVNFKSVFLLNIKVPLFSSYVKDVFRDVCMRLGIDIRYRIDVGDDNWIGKDTLLGKTTLILRCSNKLKASVVDDLNLELNSLGLLKHLEVISFETFDVNDFRNIVEKYDRCIYSCYLNVGFDVPYDLSESKGGWRQLVLQWNGDVVEERVDGKVRVKVEKVSGTESDIYKVLVDAPYGLNINRILEQEFSLKKGTLTNYPVTCEYIYESVPENKRLLGRAVCPLTKTAIERTVGGYVGEYSISGLLSVSDSSSIAYDKIKKFTL